MGTPAGAGAGRAWHPYDQGHQSGPALRQSLARDGEGRAEFSAGDASCQGLRGEGRQGAQAYAPGLLWGAAEAGPSGQSSQGGLGSRLQVLWTQKEDKAPEGVGQGRHRACGSQRHLAAPGKAAGTTPSQESGQNCAQCSSGSFHDLNHRSHHLTPRAPAS